MKTFLKTLGLFLCLLSSSLYAQAQQEGTYIDEAQQLLEEAVKVQHFVGLAAGISIDGEMAWKGVSGYADQETKTSFTEKTLNRTASIAKSFTALAVMQLYEQGLIKLESPIKDYIIEFPNEDGQTIIVSQLLNHTSGIKGYASAKEAETKNHYPTLTDAMKVFMNRELAHEPGADHLYTTYGYVVLGVLIERVSGMSYEDYMQKNIFDKAGMMNTGVEKAGESYQNKSTLYHRNRKGKIKEGNTNDLSNRIPGGGFYTTISDLLSFGEAILDNKLVSEATLKMMIADTGLKKVGNPYGYGFFLYAGQPEPGLILGHSGAQTGVSSQFFVNLVRKSVIVVLGNTSGSGAKAFELTAHLHNLAKKMQSID